MHFPLDAARLATAKQKRLPVFFTACDSAAPMKEITTHRNRVTCDGCLDVMPAAPVEESPAPPSPSLDLTEGLDDIGADLDDFDDLDSLMDEEPMGDGPGVELDPPVPEPAPDPEPPEEEVLEPPSSPLGELAPMLDMVLEGFDPEYVGIERWTLSAEEDELLGAHGIDLRGLLEADELDFVVKLIGLSQMIGIEGLATRVVAILHRALDRVAEGNLELDRITDPDNEG